MSMAVSARVVPWWNEPTIHQSSIQRIAKQDLEMRGKVLKKDDRVRWFISSANRDPHIFENPDAFASRPARCDSGIHHCPGATLARVEGQEVFKALSKRFYGSSSIKKRWTIS